MLTVLLRSNCFVKMYSVNETFQQTTSSHLTTVKLSSVIRVFMVIVLISLLPASLSAPLNCGTALGKDFLSSVQ